MTDHGGRIAGFCSVPTSGRVSVVVIQDVETSAWFEDTGGAVRDDLGHGWANLGAVEAHHHHGIGAQLGGVSDHALDSVLARSLEQVGVLDDLTAGERAELRDDVRADAAAADDDAEDLAFDFANPPARPVLSG